MQFSFEHNPVPNIYYNREECQINNLLQVSNFPWQCQVKETNQVKDSILFSYYKCLG